MIANVNPSHMTYEDSHNTLKYANRAKSLKVSPVARESIKDGGNWIEREAKLKEENMHLRRRVAELELLVEALQAGMDMEEDTAPTQTLSIPRNQKSESVGCYKGNHHQTLLPIDEEAIECNKSNSLCTTEESMEDIAAASSDKMDDKDSFDTHIARVGETYNNETRNILSDSALEAGLFDDDDAPTPIKSLDGESETYLPCPLSNKRPLLNEANLLDSQLVHTQSKKSRRESLIPIISNLPKKEDDKRNSLFRVAVLTPNPDMITENNNSRVILGTRKASVMNRRNPVRPRRPDTFLSSTQIENFNPQILPSANQVGSAELVKSSRRKSVAEVNQLINSLPTQFKTICDMDSSGKTNVDRSGVMTRSKRLSIAIEEPTVQSVSISSLSNTSRRASMVPASSRRML
jgi:hypothetical protein